jgi:hypothetical protein
MFAECHLLRSKNPDNRFLRTAYLSKQRKAGEVPAAKQIGWRLIQPTEKRMHGLKIAKTAWN